MNIVITGFMASGKTEISKQLHKLSGYSLVDTDELIVKKTGMSINEIFEKKGEEAFREIEHNVISEVSKRDNTIISTGGGVPLNEINMDELRKNGIIVNLAPDFDVIKQRLTNARSTHALKGVVPKEKNLSSTLVRRSFLKSSLICLSLFEKRGF